MHDDDNRDQENEAPPRVEHEREANVQKRQSHVERIAREAKRTGGDDSRRRARGIHVRARGLQRPPSRNRDDQSEEHRDEAEPGSQRVAEDRHRPEPTKDQSRDEHRDAHPLRSEGLPDRSAAIPSVATMSTQDPRGTKRNLEAGLGLGGPKATCP